MKIRFTTKEVSALVISALVLGFVFGFDDGRKVFDFSLWFSNFLLMTILALFSLIIFVAAQKWTACKYGGNLEYSVWKFRRWGFARSSYLHRKGEGGQKGSSISWIPLGIIIPALFAFLSEGYVFFAVTGMILISSKARHRLGKEFLGLTDFEYSKIAVAGPMACIIFALILSLVNTLSVAVVWLIKINIALAIANMLPIPLITGSVAFFGSKFFYLFSFVFIIFASILMWYINFFFVIFFALILASLLVTIAYYFGEVK